MNNRPGLLRALAAPAVLAAAILVALLRNPADALADTRMFSASIPKSVVDNLDASAHRFRSGGAGSKVVFPLPLKDGVLQVQLEPHDIRSPKYRAQVSGNGTVSAVDVNIQLFKGAAGSEDAGTFTRFSISRDSRSRRRTFSGYVRRSGTFYRIDQDQSDEETFNVSALSEQEADAMIAACATDHSLDAGGAHVSFSNSQTRSAPPLGADQFKVVEIATDADFEYFTQSGGASQANASILSILNAVDAIYRSQLGSTFSVTFQNVWSTSSDPYTATVPGTLLNQMVTYWNTNFSNSQTYDTAHLWTGKDLDGNVIGIAYISALCGSFRYGLSQRLGSAASDVPLAAHELGHNFGANHDATCSNPLWVMCPSLQANANVFSPASMSSVSSHLNAVGCLSLDDGGGGNSPPVLAPIGGRSVQETSTLTINLSATDADDDSVTFSAAPLPAGANLSGQTFTYTPPQGTVAGGTANQTATVTFGVSDGVGGTDSEAVTITVTKRNRQPVLTNPGSATAAEGTTFTRQFQASDPDGDPVAFYAPANLPPGALLSSTGLLTWRPAGNQSGSYSIQIGARDDFGGFTTGSLTLTVTNVPNVPNLPSSYVFGDLSGTGKASLSVFRNFSGYWYSADKDRLALGQYDAVQFGLPGDIPVPGDYNGDRITDYAVFRPTESRWYMRYSGTNAVASFAYGLTNDIPAPADYDGDGRTDLAVFRGSIGALIYRASNSISSSDTVVSIGQRGDIPVPCNYDSDPAAEVAVFRPSTGVWLVAGGGPASTTLGGVADIPVPGDYNRDGVCDKAVWRPSTGEWITQTSTVQFGLGGDVPVPADYDGDGDVDIAVFRPSQALWYIRSSNGGATTAQLGLFNDAVTLREAYLYAMRISKGSGTLARSDEAGAVSIFRRSQSQLFTLTLNGLAAAAVSAPVGSYFVQGDYDGDGISDRALYNSGFWTLYYGNGTLGSTIWGINGDVPISGDFDGDGRSDIAVFRPSNSGIYSAWYIINSRNGAVTTRQFGLQGDQPIAADFNGDGWTDVAVYRASLGTWYVLDSRSGWLIQSVQWGLPGDIVRTADFDGDGRADKIAWRNGTWYVFQSSGAQVAVAWGLAGDIPVPGRYLDANATDYAVYRPGTATLYVLTKSGVPFSRAAGLSSSDQVVGVQPYQPVR